ncbi:Uncharacterized protein GBIM_00922, partial [Gryllus bimaculatus]
DCEPQPGEQAEVLSPADEQPQYIYPNGYVDGVIYVNGGYEWYDPYGNVTVVVGPAPPFAGPGGGASVLAAVPCQPLPLQPIEWFNPAYGVPYVAPALPHCPRERDRRKRCSADSQPHPPPQPQAYMYPGAYMFGQPIYSMNGITVQSTPQLPQNTDNSGSKRRKKKRRRRRRRGGVDDGSEETSSDEKDLEEPASLTSQESSQEVESDSKNSAGSASCPTIVGCPELPERTPESPSSSPSLSPSLSPSPSPSNTTEDKTALPKVNCEDTKTQQEKINVRSEGTTENAETLETKTSLQGADLSCIPNFDVHKLNETNLQTPTIIQNGDSNDGPVLVIDASKTNGNCPVVGGKSFELDNNLPVTNSFSVSACGDSEVVNSAGFTNECVTKNNVPISKQKSKGKKGLKNNKQKAQFPIQNGFSEVQINEHSSKSHGTPTEMDGNETGGLAEDKSPSISRQPQLTSKQDNDFKSESETSSGSTLHLDNNITKNKVDLHSHSPEAPKKPVRTHHQNRQQPKSQVASTQQQQQEDESLNFSSVIQTGSETIGETNLTHPAAVLQSDSKTNTDVPVTVVPVSESKPSETELENSEINFNKRDIIESDLLNNKQSVQLERAVCEEKFNAHAEKDTEAASQEHKELPNKETPITSQDEQKIFSKLPSTGDLSTTETQKGIESCDTNENNKNDAQKSLSSVPEWATSTPPIPPPRRKKWQPKSSVERPPTPGRELEVKKRGEIVDDSSSSSSRESEESVIDLLSSSPNDKSKDTKEFLHEIRYVKSDTNITTKTLTGLGASPRTESHKELVQNIKLSKGRGEARVHELIDEHASKPDESICISKKSIQISKGDQSRNKQSELKSGLLREETISNVGTHNIHVDTTDKAAKTYADDLACQVLDEGLSSAATCINKTYQTQSLSLTEAVTQWLHSQDSEEVLQVPQLLDSESDIEDVEEASEEEIQMTGPKNVYRNPLLAPSCEAENIRDDAGIRVANLENKNTLIIQEEIDTLEVNVLPGSESMKNSIFSENLVNELENQYLIEPKKQSCEIINDKLSSSVSSSNCTLMQKDEEKNMLEKSDTKDSRPDTQGPRSEEWDSFTSESVEYDADWECDPVPFKNSSQVFTREDEDSNLSLESTDDKCSYMCDPSLSVAKYYRLGPPPEREINVKDEASDIDSGKDDANDDEGMDALIHFRNELEEYSQEGVSSFSQRLPMGSQPVCPTRNKVEEEILPRKKSEEIYDLSYDGFTSDSGIHSEESCNEDSHRASNSSKSITEAFQHHVHKSAILLSHLGAEGPFPCGGICCILQ